MLDTALKLHMLHDKSSLIAFDGEGVQGDITGSVMVTVCTSLGVDGGHWSRCWRVLEDVTEAVVDSWAEFWTYLPGDEQHKGDFFPFLLAPDGEARVKEKWLEGR